MAMASRGRSDPARDATRGIAWQFQICCLLLPTAYCLLHAATAIATAPGCDWRVVDRRARCLRPNGARGVRAGGLRACGSTRLASGRASGVRVCV